jgi:hypothetical protein
LNGYNSAVEDIAHFFFNDDHEKMFKVLEWRRGSEFNHEDVDDEE